MKNRMRKILYVAFAMTLAFICAFTLFACNKDRERKEKDARLRAENVAVLKDKILSAMDENWTGSLDNQAVAALNNVGDYVIAAGWTDMICGVFRKSALQTGKLTALKNYVLSEDGQKLLDDFEGNAELLIPLMRAADFTPTDISNLVYDLLCALVSDSGNAIDSMTAKLSEIKQIAGISAITVENIEKSSLNLAVIKNQFVPNAQEKEQMLKAFSAAKAPMGKIIEFAYNMSIGSITDNIFNALFSADGALSDISNGEIKTVIDTLVNNAVSLKDALDDSSIANLNNAMGLIIAKFDKEGGNSMLYGQVVQYAKYAYMVVDVMPAICDVIGSAGKVFDNQLIEQLRGVSSVQLDENTQNVNNAIIVAKTVIAVSGDFTPERLFEIIDKVAAQTGDDYKKMLPLMALDISLNLSFWLKDVENTAIAGKHPELMGENDVKAMVGTILLNFGLEKAKQTYKAYQNGECPFTTVMNAVYSCGFGNFDIVNPYNPGLVAECDAWYRYYMNQGVDIVNAGAVNVCERVVLDIKQFISDFYAPESQSKALTQKIASWQLIGENLAQEAYAVYEEEILNSDIIGIIGLINVIFK